MNKVQYDKWLTKRGLAPQQIAKKKKELGSPNSIPSYQVPQTAPLSNTIPSNGQMSADTSKSEFARRNYAMVPSYNKGPIQPVSKEDLKHGAGRKL